MYLVQKLIIEILSLSFTIFSALILRWLLYLSTPQKDWYWLCNQGIWGWYTNLSWYRGTEYMHQMKASRIIDASIEVLPEE